MILFFEISFENSLQKYAAYSLVVSFLFSSCIITPPYIYSTLNLSSQVISMLLPPLCNILLIELFFKREITFSFTVLLKRIRIGVSHIVLKYIHWKK